MLIWHNVSQRHGLRLPLLFFYDLFPCHMDWQKQEKKGTFQTTLTVACAKFSCANSRSVSVIQETHIPSAARTTSTTNAWYYSYDAATLDSFDTAWSIFLQKNGYKMYNMVQLMEEVIPIRLLQLSGVMSTFGNEVEDFFIEMNSMLSKTFQDPQIPWIHSLAHSSLCPTALICLNHVVTS